ncbi:MAG: hypothetical protein ACW7DY_21405 [Paraglaciecola chathamensis]
MKIRAILTIIICAALVGCGHYNYAVKRDGSLIPYKNQYDGDENQEYEFYSTLYKVNSDKKYSDLVEITHLNDVYNHRHGTPETTWRKSRLSFNLSKNSGVKLILGSVVLEHYSESGHKYKPSKVESTLSKCTKVNGCREYLVLHYEEGMPKKIIEMVSFTVVLQGKEKHISYKIPLEYKYHYSFWDVMMGV